ncbi:hypothetical protein [Neorhizobium sp. JUb45]|uniref:hypothetical protein n=1 Tax=unclassified Neorhizobium TaxID=2629175 RepID=UPI00104757A8|nr:hypothetical protein [Neorhizobium sp. JUb45]TCR04344.1 hypothetical protein EDF70_102442 [Neorhizobium sp. JUb45]
MGIAYNSMFSSGTTAVEPDFIFELPDFTASCEDARAGIATVFSVRSDLCSKLELKVRDLKRRNPRMPKRQVSHLALVELITEERDCFPPQEFVLQTDLGDGAIAIDTIASAEKLRAKRLLAEMMETPAETAERLAVREARTDAFTVRAHGQIVSALLFGRE